MTTQQIWCWFRDHYHARLREVGHFRTAQQMRKQGVPIQVALAVLVGRTPRGAR